MQPGDRVSASEYNRLVERAERSGRTEVNAASGLRLRASPAGMLLDWEIEQFFPAKITAVTHGTSGAFNGLWLYTWNEQRLDLTTGLYTDLAGGRSGTQAIETNNVYRGNFPWYVTDMKLYGFVAPTTIYKFTYPAQLTFVQITGPLQSNGFYPGVEMVFNPKTLTWSQGDVVWWRDANQ